MEATMCICCPCQHELHLVWMGVFHYQDLKEYEELEKIESMTILGALQHCWSQVVKSNLFPCA